MHETRKPTFLKRLLWASAPLLMLALLRFILMGPGHCGTYMLGMTFIMFFATCAVAYWALWALL